MLSKFTSCYGNSYQSSVNKRQMYIWNKFDICYGPSYPVVAGASGTASSARKCTQPCRTTRSTRRYPCSLRTSLDICTIFGCRNEPLRPIGIIQSPYWTNFPTTRKLPTRWNIYATTSNTLTKFAQSLLQEIYQSLIWWKRISINQYKHKLWMCCQCHSI